MGVEGARTRPVGSETVDLTFSPFISSRKQSINILFLLENNLFSYLCYELQNNCFRNKIKLCNILLIEKVLVAQPFFKNHLFLYLCENL
jgi:hypothetical protein